MLNPSKIPRKGKNKKKVDIHYKPHTLWAVVYKRFSIPRKPILTILDKKKTCNRWGRGNVQKFPSVLPLNFVTCHILKKKIRFYPSMLKYITTPFRNTESHMGKTPSSLLKNPKWKSKKLKTHMKIQVHLENRIRRVIFWRLFLVALRRFFASSILSFTFRRTIFRVSTIFSAATTTVARAVCSIKSIPFWH